MPTASQADQVFSCFGDFVTSQTENVSVEDWAIIDIKHQYFH